MSNDEQKAGSGTLERDLAKLEVSVAQLADSSKRVEDKVDRLTGLIDGNGRAGLRMRLDRVERAVPDQLPMRLDRVEQDRSTLRWFGAVVIAALTAIGLRLFFGG